jgi:hypothetical protein
MGGIVVCVVAFWLTGQLLFWFINSKRTKTIGLPKKILIGFGIWWAIAMIHLTFQKDAPHDYEITGNRLTWIGSTPPASTVSLLPNLAPLYGTRPPLYLIGAFDGKNREWAISQKQNENIAPSTFSQSEYRVYYGLNDSAPQAEGIKGLEPSSSALGWVIAVIWSFWICKTLLLYASSRGTQVRETCTSRGVCTPVAGGISDAHIVV